MIKIPSFVWEQHADTMVVNFNYTKTMWLIEWYHPVQTEIQNGSVQTRITCATDYFLNVHKVLDDLGS